MSADDFLHTTLPVLGKRVHRLGLACSYGIDNAGVHTALHDRGLGFVFWTPRQKGEAALKAALKRNREGVVLMTGPTTAHWSGNLTRYVDKALKRLETDHLDVLMTFWVGVTSTLNEARFEEMVRLRESGKVREQDIFPHLSEDRPRVVLAYTATRWRKLLKRPRGWTGPVMSAADCYRFCLSNRHVHAVLGGPKSLPQLDENLDGLAKGALTQEETIWMREFGRVVHG